MQTQETKDQLIARLIAENAALKTNQKPAARGEISLSPKGCIMFKPAGIKGWPVTLYAGTWAAIFERQDEIKAFIADNATALVALKAGAQ
jgi:hypothetical protein